jgi:hypothetical protein
MIAFSERLPRFASPRSPVSKKALRFAVRRSRSIRTMLRPMASRPGVACSDWLMAGRRKETTRPALSSRVMPSRLAATIPPRSALRRWRSGCYQGTWGLHLHQPRVRLVSFGDVSVDVGAEIIDPLQRCVGHSIEPSRREVAELLDVIAEGDDDVVSRVIQSRAFFRSPSIGSTAQLMSTASCVVLARSFTSSARR